MLCIFLGNEEIERRRDLRDLCLFTIDPSTATDFDDALLVEKLSGGNLKVGVHIADAYKRQLQNDLSGTQDMMSGESQGPRMMNLVLK